MVRLVACAFALFSVAPAARLAEYSKKAPKRVPCPKTLQCCTSCKEKYYCPTTKECVTSTVRYTACDVAVCGPRSHLKEFKPSKGSGGGPLQKKYEPIPAGKPLVWEKAEGSLLFFVIGDWGGSSDNEPVTGRQKQTAKGMSRVGALMRPEFVVGLGDNFYPGGVHKWHNYQRFNQTYENVYTHESLQVPWYNCVGNHDWARGGKKVRSIQTQIEYTTKSPRWVLPGAVYSLTKSLPSGKTVKFVFMDSLMVEKKFSYTEMPAGAAKNQEAMRGVEYPKGAGLDAWKWFEEQLATSKDDYLFVIDHQPVYTICSHGNSPALFEMPKLMTKYKVSAFMSGHDHCMMHIKHDGNHYIQSGASSQAWNVPTWEKTTTELGVEVPFAIHRSNRGKTSGVFNSVELTDTEARIKSIDDKGTVLYEFDDIKPRNL